MFGIVNLETSLAIIFISIERVEDNAKDFGVPQHRERIFIIGTHGKAFNFSQLPTKIPPQLRDFLDVKGDFEITTHFNNDSASILKAGKETILIADVVVKKDAEYVMINIPIPGGCSYVDKKTYYRNESNREYFRNETTIFCEHLQKGKYTFEVKLMPRYNGKYTLNPAKVELMYFPVFNANNETKKVKIK